jgi:dUTPase
MFRIINNIIDRCFFTITFIIGVQLPAFIIQYKHRLSGHLSESKLHLVQFQTIADQHYQGDLSAMVIKYQTNSEPSIVNTADIINQLIVRVNYLQEQLSAVTNNAYIDQIINIIINADKAIIRDTLIDFSIAIPLEVNALSTGVILAISALLMKEAFDYLLKGLKQKFWPELS